MKIATSSAERTSPKLTVKSLHLLLGQNSFKHEHRGNIYL